MEQNSLLWSQNDFSDFKDFSSNTIKSRSDSSSSTHSSFDTDYRDTVYAQQYFKGSSSSKTSSDNDLIIVSSIDDDDVIILDSPPPPVPNDQDHTHKTVLTNKKQKNRRKMGKKKKKTEDNSPSMELDTDCEIIGTHPQSIKDNYPIITSDRQATVQARPPDKMATNDKWFLVEKDLVGRERYEQLYEFKRYNIKHVKCINCKQKGHTREDCPQAKRHTICYLCGTVDHISSRCPDSVCQYCFQPSHRGRPCRSSLSNPREHCKRCYMKGHAEHLCPEGWRQFHNTTHNSTSLYKLDQTRPDHLSYCCICSVGGHYSYECSRQRPRGYPIPFTPLIAYYDDRLYLSLTKNDSNDNQFDRHSRKRKNIHNIEYEQTERKHPRHHHYHDPSDDHRVYNDQSRRRSAPAEPRRSLTEPLFRTPSINTGHMTGHLTGHMTSTPNYHRTSIHDRLDPLLPNDYQSPQPIRSLSFEHSRIPEAIFNTPSMPPRWDTSNTDYPDYPPRPSTPPPPEFFTSSRQSSYSNEGQHSRDYQRPSPVGMRRNTLWPSSSRRWSVDDQRTRQRRHY